ncbi:MAG: TRAP transporter fused permease subunit [Thermodesulfovibrio sp.]|nr:TRAP transporter fused permease subunit [Thermodesulfovibrio sp.]
MRELSGFWKLILNILVGLWGVFILYTALLAALHPLLQGGISLSIGLAIVFLVYPLSKRMLKWNVPKVFQYLLTGTQNSPSLLDLIFIVISLIPCIYIMIHWEEVVRNPGVFETYHLVLAVLLIIALIEGTRRALGLTVPILVLFFIVYTIAGPHIPGRFAHPGFSLTDILYQLYLMTEGIWGLLPDMASRIIAPFIIFGPILFATGVGSTVMELSTYFGGKIRGGPGHVAVISSSLFGMLSGSSVANAATTGSFTIPLMKKFGFSRAFASAVEAAASSGGQIMPPIMGAGCFIMAEFLNIPYAHIMIAGLIPALIYFAGIAAGVWIEAGRTGMGKLPKELMPDLKTILKPQKILNFILPIGTLGVLLFMFFPAQICAAWAIVVSVVYYTFFGGPLKGREILNRIKAIWGGLFEGVVKALAWLMIMMACVQIAVSLISLTGFGVKVSEIIIEISGYNVYLALIATMLTAIILGMGMTTTAAYVIAAAVLVPALQQMGVNPLAAHLFIFYFAIKSGLTPPVCITVFTTTAIAGGSWLRAAWYSMKLGIGGYIMPFFFIFVPAYLMKGSPWEILFIFIGAFVAMFAIEAGVLGYWTKPSTPLERVLYIAGGLIMMAPGYWTFIGLALFLIGILLEKFDVQIPVIAKRPAHVIVKQKD